MKANEVKIDTRALGQIVVVGISYFSLVLGELVPKSLALRAGERYALLVARPLLWLSWLAQPAVWLLTKSSNVVLRPFGDSTTFTEARLSQEELRQLVDEATSAGTVDEASGEIASRALDFGDLTAASIMVPRNRVVGIPRRAGREEIRRIVLEHGKARMPIFGVDRRDVVGYVTARDLTALLLEDRVFGIDDLVRPAFVVPEQMRLVELLKEMRGRRVQLAIVVDESGEMSGIVTLEDVVEELVGDIRGEHDADSTAVESVEPDGTAVVRGDASVRDVNRELDLLLPLGDRWTTVAGLVLEVAGRIPEKGERFDVSEDCSVEVLEASAQRIEKLRIRAHRPTAAANGIATPA